MRVSSGLGPMTVSNRGLRLSGGVGPFSVGVSSRGISGGIGVGPFTASGSARLPRVPSGSFGGLTRPTKQHASTRRYADRFDAYEPTAANPQSTRRSREEIRLASIYALMADAAPMVAWARTYAPLTAPPASAVGDGELRRLAEQQLKQEGRLTWTTRHKAELIQRRTDALQQDFLHRMAVHEHTVLPTVEKFRQLDWTTNIVVFQEVFADNGLAAVAFDLNDAHLDVLMTYPEAERIIWPEKFEYRESTVLGVRKRTKKELRNEYKLVMFQHMCATAKEALQTQPALESVRVMAVKEANGVRLADLEVLGDVTLERKHIEMLSVAGEWTAQWDNVLDTWDRSDGMVPHDPAFQFELDLLSTVDQLGSERTRLDSVLGLLKGVQSKKTEELLTLGRLAEVFDHPLLALVDDEGSFEDLAVIEVDEHFDAGSADFWVHVADTVSLWESDEELASG